MIPTFKALSDVYVDAAPNVPRYESLKKLHASKFGKPVDFVVRAPGRVNLIGEHVDTSFFAVLPMAIRNDTIMAVTVTDEAEIRIVNVDSDRFDDSQFELPANGEPYINAEKLHWSNYMKAGYTVAIRHLRKTQQSIKPKGLLISMTGNVPEGGGLSSSAAFVVSATLVTLHANGEKDVSKKLLTELSITSEQLLGMNTGGMDQAASIFGEKDHVLLINFRPKLEAVPKSLPQTKEPLVFLVANSLATSVKHLTAPIHYNLRVVEITVATNILAKKLGLSIPQDGNLHAGTLRGIYEAYLGSNTVTQEGLEKLAVAVQTNLDKTGYTREEAAALLGITDEDFHRKYLTEFPVRFERLKCWHRALHVYEEAKRVLEFVDIVNKGGENAEILLGTLMNESHRSAQYLFENSHPEVDMLVGVAREAGSLGSRSTGAGWGGSTVHLVAASKAETVKNALWEKYYAKVYPNAPKDALIETVPAAGAAILEPTVLG